VCLETALVVPVPISIFDIEFINLVLAVVCFLLGNSPASEFYMPTFRTHSVCSIFIGK